MVRENYSEIIEESSNIKCPNCGSKTAVVSGGMLVRRICKTAGCSYPDGQTSE